MATDQESLAVGWFSRSQKNVDKALDLASRAGGAIDRLHYSDEEKAEAAIAEANQIRDWKLEFLKALEPFRELQQRVVVIIMTAWAFLIVNLVASAWLNEEIYQRLLGLITEEFVVYPTIAAVSLYLGGGTVREFFVNRKKD